jgi:hypothetical protein
LNSRESPGVVPTSNLYRRTPVPPIHWNCTVDEVSVDPGAGVVISAAATALVVAV